MIIENGFSLATDDLFELIRSVYESTDAFAADFAEEYPSPSVLRIRLDEIWRRPGSLCLVARDGIILSGFLFVAPRSASKLRHTADLNMGVRAEARGKGVGGRLLSTALSRLRSEGIIELLYLMVRADNTSAVRFYRKHGFEELATLAEDTKIGGQYYDGILMRVRLRGEP